MLREAIESVPESARRIYVVDGRYATFDGETDLTPGAADLAAEFERAEYVEPDPDQLPFGHDRPSGTPVRWPVHLKQRWVFEDVLPQDEWVLKMDTDERVETIDAELFERLPRRWKAAPRVDTLWERGVAQPRIYVPEYWTYWLADVAFPRYLYPRGTDAETLYEAEQHYDMAPVRNVGSTPAVQLRNVGDDRPEDYRERRADQLDVMGRHGRAAEYREAP